MKRSTLRCGLSASAKVVSPCHTLSSAHCVLKNRKKNFGALVRCCGGMQHVMAFTFQVQKRVVPMVREGDRFYCPPVR